MPSMPNSQSSPASHRSWTFCTICPASPVMAKWPVCCGVDLKADSEGKELNFNKKQAIYSGWWKNTKANGKIKQEEKKTWAWTPVTLSLDTCSSLPYWPKGLIVGKEHSSSYWVKKVGSEFHWPIWNGLNGQPCHCSIEFAEKYEDSVSLISPS